MRVPLNEQIFEQHQIIESDKANLPKGVLCRVAYPICNIGALNKNKRMYEQAVWDKVFTDKEILEKMKTRSLFGQAEHPDVTQSNLEKTSHVITGMTFNKDKTKVMQEMDILDTPYGRIVDTLLEAGCLVGVSTRAEGEMEEAVDDDGNKYSRVVPEHYDYRTTDFTADPSTVNPYPEKVERDLVTQVQTGIDSEKIDREFATALLEKMHCSEAKVLLESIKEGSEKKIEETKPDSTEGVGETEPTTESTLAFECFDDMVKYLEKAFAEDDKIKTRISNLINEATGNDVVPESEYSCKGCGKKFESESELNAEGLCPECAEAVKDISMEYLDKQMKGIQISEASVRAERDKAFDMLCEVEKNLEAKDNTHGTELSIILSKVHKLDEVTQKKLSILYSVLEKRVGDIKTLERTLKSIKENHSQELNILINKHIREKAELKSNNSKEVISNYVTMKVEARGLTIPKNSQALLEECISVEEADRVLENIVDAMREGALHSQQLMEIAVTKPSSPETDRVRDRIGKTFDGFFGQR